MDWITKTYFTYWLLKGALNYTGQISTYMSLYYTLKNAISKQQIMQSVVT